MKVVAIIQARAGKDSRLPGKVLEKIGDLTMLDLIIGRVAQAKRVDEIWLASPWSDDELLHRATFVDGVFPGSENDVLDRYYRCAMTARADIIVRVTADDPMKDPQLIDEGIELQAKTDAPFVTNMYPRSYPIGLDVEVFPFSTLKASALTIQDPYDREHVTQHIYRQFKTEKFSTSPSYGDWRWTVDYESDLEWFRRLSRRFDLLYTPWTELRDYLLANPEEIRRESDIRQRA